MAKNPLATAEYLNRKRFFAYYYQFSEIDVLQPENILEIGAGNGIVAAILAKCGHRVTTLDNWDQVEPDILASATDIPLADNSFDVVVAYQVLEHLPYEDFLTALAEIHRVARRHVLISLPNAQPSMSVTINIPKHGQRTWQIPLPFLKTSPPSEYHQWETNQPGYPLSRIIADLTQTGLRLQKHYRIPEFPYHHMFTLEK